MTLDLANPVEIAAGAGKKPAAKLHVLTLTPFYPSLGDEVSGCFVAETLRELESLGVKSSVIAVDSVYHPRREANQKFPAAWMRYPQIPGNLGLSTAGRFLSASVVNRIRQIHSQTRIDLIHAHAALPCGAAAAHLSRRLGIPFVVTIHGLDVFNRCFADGIAAGWRRRASTDVYQAARRVICISGRIRRLLLEGMGDAAHAEVVYNGTDADFFSPGEAERSRPLVLVVGNLLAGKGQELVFRALAALKNSLPELRCELIGEGADRERFTRLAAELGISGQIHFLGRRSRAEVAQAMRECAVFALPSRFEGLGCVYLEAMACGKPVIACRGQGIDEIVVHGKNGWLVPVDGLNELIDGLRTLLSDRGLRTQIGQSARQTILEGLTMNHQARALQATYQEAAR
ncbi:MAG TPA: glycosyltransferase family 4 protein [Candidatus Binatia bacterium]|nr:glycosyltransferase family 4 protein [Candidatus Binatia bacterium]